MPPSVVLYSSGFPTITAVNFDNASAILYFILPTSFRCSRLSRVIIIFFIVCNHTYICRFSRVPLFSGGPVFLVCSDGYQVRPGARTDQEQQCIPAYQPQPKFLDSTEIFRRTGIFIFFLPIVIFRRTRNFQTINFR